MGAGRGPLPGPSPSHIEEEDMPIRDYIPADAELTAEELAYFERRSGGLPPTVIDDAGRLRIVPDYIPAEPTPPDISLEEKMRMAQEAADAAVRREAADAKRIAAEKLRRMDVADAVEFIRGLSPSDQRLYLEAELEGQARKGILLKFKHLLEEA